MPALTVVYGEETKTIDAPDGSVLGEVVPVTGLPLEQPCARRGTCGKCKVLVEAGVALPDDVELEHLTPGELALDNLLISTTGISMPWLWFRIRWRARSRHLINPAVMI